MEPLWLTSGVFSSFFIGSPCITSHVWLTNGLTHVRNIIVDKKKSRMTWSYLDYVSFVHKGEDAPPNMTILKKKGARLCESQEKGMLSRRGGPPLPRRRSSAAPLPPIPSPTATTREGITDPSTARTSPLRTDVGDKEQKDRKTKINWLSGPALMVVIIDGG